MAEPVVIRPFTEDDIDFAVAQARREQWDVTPPLFGVLLAHDPDGCWIAKRNGRPVGMVTSTVYRDSAWVGNLIVLPECRKQGIGESLMSQVLDRLDGRGVRTIRLEADPPGVKLYRRLGFVDDFESLRFKHDAVAGARDDRVETLREEDLPAVLGFDAERFGDDRGRLLTLSYTLAITACWWCDGERIRGYAMALPSAFGARVGPWVADDGQVAGALLDTVFARLQGASVHLGVPAGNAAAIDFLELCGFRRAPSSLRMVRGDRAARERAGAIFGIGGGATG